MYDKGNDISGFCSPPHKVVNSVIILPILRLNMVQKYYGDSPSLSFWSWGDSMDFRDRQPGFAILLVV